MKHFPLIFDIVCFAVVLALVAVLADEALEIAHAVRVAA